MVKQDPDERPTVLDVLTGDHIPQDKGFEQMKELLENHNYMASSSLSGEDIS